MIRIVTKNEWYARMWGVVAVFGIMADIVVSIVTVGLMKVTLADYAIDKMADYEGKVRDAKFDAERDRDIYIATIADEDDDA